MNQRAIRFQALSLCCAFWTAATITPYSLRPERPKSIPGGEVDRSVIAALSHRGVMKPRVISHIDLTEYFGTAKQWTFVVARDGDKPTPDFENHGPIFLCLVKATSPDCAQDLYQQIKGETPRSDKPYHLFAVNVVYAKQNKSEPLLFLEVCGEQGPNGNCEIATALYRYDEGADRFIRVFLNITGRNNNQATRFVESGPLQGDVVIDNPTENAPYTYWIEVYRAGDSGQYGRILRYRGLTRYSDGNPLAVADSEMPEILRRLGFWRPGDPLPVPPHMPKGCRGLFMRHGEEWCR